MSRVTQNKEAPKQRAVKDRAPTGKQPCARRASTGDGADPHPGEAPGANAAPFENPSLIASTPQPRVLRVLAASGNRSPFSLDEDVDSLDVYALPNYAVNGKTDRAHQAFCGQVANTSDWITQIQSIWSGGVYVVRERKANGAFGKTQTVNVPSLPEVEAQAEDDELRDDEDFADDDRSYADPRLFALERQNQKLQIELARMIERERVRAEASPKSIPQKSLLEQLRELKEAQSLLAPSPAINANPAPARSLADELTELMRGDLLKQIRELYRNPDAPIPNSDDEEKRPSNVWDFLTSAVNSPIGEALAPVLNVLGQNVIAAQPGNADPQAAPRPPATDSVQNQSELPPHHFNATDPQAAYQQLLTQVLTALDGNAPVEPVATAVDAFLLQHPQYEETVLNFLGYSPKELLAIIAQFPGASHLPGLPHAEGWLIQLQQSLFPEDEIGGSGETPSVPAPGGTDAPSGGLSSAP